MTSYTSTNAVAEPKKTAEEMLKAITEALKEPRLIGSLGGIPVYIDDRLPDRIVELRSGDQTVRFRADHPYLDGTKFAEAVRKPVRLHDRPEDHLRPDAGERSDRNPGLLLRPQMQPLDRDGRQALG